MRVNTRNKNEYPISGTHILIHKKIYFELNKVDKIKSHIKNTNSLIKVYLLCGIKSIF